MRASRLLRLLLILQNRGRQTSVQLAKEFGVTPRTILRDVNAIRQAGLPIEVHQGNRGGIDIAAGYRSRFVGLTTDEAEALGVILAAPNPVVEAIGLSDAAENARRKLVESFPDLVRRYVERGSQGFQHSIAPQAAPDPRLEVLGTAIRNRRYVRLRARSAAPQTVHPVALSLGPGGWSLFDRRRPETRIPLREWGDIEVSDHSFTELDDVAQSGETGRETGARHAR